MAKKFVVSDDAVLNDRGFRVLTSGIDCSDFNKNPLGLFMHRRLNEWSADKDSVLPIALWSEPIIEGTKLISEPTFDENDEFAKKIADKVANGFLRMASVGIVPITTSSDPQYLLPGQTYETIVKSKLVEISIVDFASNPSAIALYSIGADGQFIELSSEQQNAIIPLLSKVEETSKPNPIQMKELAKKLGLSEDATEAQFLSAVEGLQSQVQTLGTQVETINLNAITKAVDTAIAEKRFTADKREEMITLGKTIGIEKLASTMSLMNPVGKPMDVLAGAGGSGSGEEQVTLITLMAKGTKAVEEFKSEHPEEYKALYKAHYGTELV